MRLGTILLLGIGSVLSGCSSAILWRRAAVEPPSVSSSQVPARTEQDIELISNQLALFLDRRNYLSTDENPYTIRLQALAREFEAELGLQLRAAVYLQPDLYTFILPTAEVRVTAGLMDLLNDDELLYVLSHEVEHLRKGHARRRLEIAASKLPYASNNLVAIGEGELASIERVFFSVPYSLEQEREADLGSIAFLDSLGASVPAAVSALKKLSELNPPQRMLASHPQPELRMSSFSIVSRWKSGAGKSKTGKSKTGASKTMTRAQVPSERVVSEPAAPAKAVAATPPVDLSDIEAEEPRAQVKSATLLQSAVVRGWYLRPGRVATKLEAMQLANELRAVSLPVQVDPERNPPSVLIGPYSSQAEAEAQLQKIRSLDLLQSNAEVFSLP